MGILTAFHKQTATHWNWVGTDGFGNPQFAAPTTILCRWEDRSEYIINNEGDQVLSRARIFLGTDIKVGDYLFLGTSVETDPRTVHGAFRVLDFRKIPDLFNEDDERRALL